MTFYQLGRSPAPTGSRTKNSNPLVAHHADDPLSLPAINLPRPLDGMRVPQSAPRGTPPPPKPVEYPLSSMLVPLTLVAQPVAGIFHELAQRGRDRAGLRSKVQLDRDFVALSCDRHRVTIFIHDNSVRPYEIRQYQYLL